MKRATLEEAASTLAELVAAVRAGETVVITDDGVAVAELQSADRRPQQSATDEADSRRLERVGVVKRGSAPPPDLEHFPPGSVSSGVLDALLEERREGR
jgi:antitoxin (DNA-binding transcriptional repressor) of toxin-antitoxin stability system